MVFPRFNPNSFWSMQAACDAWGAKCPAPPLGMITVAALLPREWDIKLVDRNAEELKPEDIDWADMVMTGGMLPQQNDTLLLIERCQARAKPVVIGGPDPTSSPDVYGHADFLVLGEAEDIIQKFVEAWDAGERRGRYEAENFRVDVTKSPIPRFDLLNFKHYLHVGVQFSRGCPFNCEFWTSSSFMAGSRDQKPTPRCSPNCKRFTRWAIAATSISSTTISSATKKR